VRYDERAALCADRATVLHVVQRARDGQLVVEKPGRGPIVSKRMTQRAGDPSRRRRLPPELATPTDGTEAVACWVGLLDRAEALMATVDRDNPAVQRTASRALDSLYRYEHEMTPTARWLAREFVWLRDRDEPLPPEEERERWRRCLCRACRVERALGRPSIAHTMHTVRRSLLPAQRQSPVRMEQAQLPLPA
jgi:hypothetical protein